MLGGPKLTPNMGGGRRGTVRGLIFMFVIGALSALIYLWLFAEIAEVGEQVQEAMP